MRYLLTLLVLTFALTLSYGQETIIFCKKKNNNKKLSIPAGAYDIKVNFKNSKKTHALLIGHIDSTLIFKTGSFSFKTRRALRKEFRILAITSTLSLNQIDSIVKLKAYPNEIKGQLNDIKWISINNSNRPEIHTLLSIIEWTGLSSLLAFPLSIAATDAKYPNLYMTIMGIMIIDVIVSIATDTKKIRFKNWTIKMNNK